MKIEVRRANPNEAKALTSLSLRSKRSNGYDDAFMDGCREELTVTSASMNEGEYWVAVSNEMCGCVCLRPGEQKSAEICAFFVDPDWQRKGIGHLLWTKILERTRQLGIERLVLDADPYAVPFYKALGFEIISESPSGSIPGRLLPHMSIDLID